MLRASAKDGAEGKQRAVADLQMVQKATGTWPEGCVRAMVRKDTVSRNSLYFCCRNWKSRVKWSKLSLLGWAVKYCPGELDFFLMLPESHRDLNHITSLTFFTGDACVLQFQGFLSKTIDLT